MHRGITNSIKLRIIKWGGRSVFSPKDFLDIATHETARQVLTRLTKEGTLRRLMRGLYEYPEHSKLLNEFAPPDPDVMARTIARIYGWTILPSGDTALNLLGLSTQVSAQWQYYSDGPSKSFSWDGGTLVFKHRANKEVSGLSARTALMVQALKALGQQHVDSEIMKKLKKQYSLKERKHAVKEAPYVTSWIYEVIKQLPLEGEDSSA